MQFFGWFLIILLVAAVGVAVWALGAYNGFVRQRNMIQESWRQIDVELNRRYELIPNLVETVRAFAAHERNTLEEVTRLRSVAQQMAAGGGGVPSAERAEIEEQLSGAVRNLLVTVEAYPELKSNVNFLELQRELTETEDRIAAGRRYYNANVREYNTRTETVPSNFIANAFKFEKATYFEVSDPEVRRAPGVNFGEISYRGDPAGQQQVPPPAAPAQHGQLPNPQAYNQPPQQQQYQQAPPAPQQPYQPPQSPQQYQAPPAPQQPYQPPQSPQQGPYNPPQ